MSVGDVDVQGLCRGLKMEIVQCFDEASRLPDGVSPGLKLARLLVISGGVLANSDPRVIAWRSSDAPTPEDEESGINSALKILQDALDPGKQVTLELVGGEDRRLHLTAYRTKEKERQPSIRPSSRRVLLQRARNAAAILASALEGLAQLEDGHE